MTLIGFLRRTLILFALFMLLSACRGRSEPAPTQPEGIIVDVEIEPTLALPTSVTVEPGRELLPPIQMTTEELHALLNPLTESIEGCALPCYLDLEFGSSDLLDIYNFYSSIGIGIPDLVPGDYQAAEDGEGQVRAWLTRSTDISRAEELGLEPPQVTVNVGDGLAQSIIIRWDYLPSYLTPGLVPRISWSRRR